MLDDVVGFLPPSNSAKGEEEEEEEEEEKHLAKTINFQIIQVLSFNYVQL